MGQSRADKWARDRVKPLKNKVKIRILFVCMGNICRSPTAEGVFTRLVEAEGLGALIEIDSAGTHSYHIGHTPDPRAQEAAARRGVALSHLRARRLAPRDFEHYDYLVAMDEANRQDMLELAPPELAQKVHLFMDFALDRPEREVPDPYYGSVRGFEYVLDLVEDAATGLLEHIRVQHHLPRQRSLEGR
jgi:protein-tyrosine phosphatase